jgi:hypothetical protein
MKQQPLSKRRCQRYVRPLHVRSVRLDAASVRSLKRFGHGNLSDGVRKAAASRRFAQYHRMLEAAAVIEVHDRSEDMDAAIGQLVKVFRGG